MKKAKKKRKKKKKPRARNVKRSQHPKNKMTVFERKKQKLTNSRWGRTEVKGKGHE